MVETRVLNCITCPIGCEVTVELTDKVITKVSGNNCPRGEKYVQEELTAPKRMLTSTVRIENGLLPLLPVVSKSVLPKEKVLACAAVLRSITVQAPVSEGDVICKNILGLGVDIVASRDMAHI